LKHSGVRGTLTKSVNTGGVYSKHTTKGIKGQCKTTGSLVDVNCFHPFNYA